MGLDFLILANCYTTMVTNNVSHSKLMNLWSETLLRKMSGWKPTPSFTGIVLKPNWHFEITPSLNKWHRYFSPAVPAVFGYGPAKTLCWHKESWLRMISLGPLYCVIPQGWSYHRFMTLLVIGKAFLDYKPPWFFPPVSVCRGSCWSLGEWGTLKWIERR